MPTSKPTNIDAQRILAIMDELKEKLTYLSVVTPQVLEGLQSEEGQACQELLGLDVVKSFQEQIRLEQLYVDDHTAPDGTFAHAEDSEDAREELKSMQKNTLELCRKMKGVTNIVGELRAFQETRPQVVIQFLKTLTDMQELTLKRLTTTVEEERSRRDLLNHYKSRQAEAELRKKQLEKDLSHVRREWEKAQSQRTDLLTKLKADLLDVKETKADRMNSLWQRYETRRQDYEERFAALAAEDTKKINALKEDNAKQRDESQKSEAELKRAVRNKEIELQKKVIETYDTSIKEATYHLNDCHDNYKRDKKQLVELKEHFSKVEAEKECIRQESELAKARSVKTQRVQDARNESAALVQAYWRGIIQRELFQIDKKKNKKKKGGKKKAK